MAFSKKKFIVGDLLSEHEKNLDSLIHTSAHKLKKTVNKKNWKNLKKYFFWFFFLKKIIKYDGAFLWCVLRNLTIVPLLLYSTTIFIVPPNIEHHYTRHHWRLWPIHEPTYHDSHWFQYENASPLSSKELNFLLVCTAGLTVQEPVDSIEVSFMMT